MIKNIKRNIINNKLLVIVLLVSLMLVSINVIALTYVNKSTQMVFTDDGKTGYASNETTGSFDTMYTSYKTDLGTTNYNGVNYNQRVHVFFQKQTANSKVVTWAVKTNAGKFTRLPVSAIAKDYEIYHPGWKVVGAINADQYTTGFGTDIGSTGKDYYYPQPYYSMICDGEGWFIMSGMPVGGGQTILGFLQDGSADPLINGSTNIKSGDIDIEAMYLYILDSDGNRLEKFQVHHINETPRELETTVWTSYYNSKEEFPDITVYGNLYVVKRAERAIANNSIDYSLYKGDNGQNAFFGKGIISEVTNKATFGYGAFAIDTKDEYLQSKLSKGVRIMVQYEVEGDFSKVESAIGYHTIHRMHGQDLKVVGSYNTNKYTRSIVGRTADGKIFLMAVDQTNYSGMNAEEVNATLKYYGVVEAYQMDGGGSTTAVVRNELLGSSQSSSDVFKVVNSPRDGSPRSVFSALLLVEKVEETSLNVIYDSIYNKEIYIDNKSKNILF